MMEERCAASIWSGFNSYQCSNKGKFFENGKHWCGIHAPSKVKKKEEEREKAWEIKRFERQQQSIRDAAALLRGFGWTVTPPEGDE